MLRSLLAALRWGIVLGCGFLALASGSFAFEVLVVIPRAVAAAVPAGAGVIASHSTIIIAGHQIPDGLTIFVGWSAAGVAVMSLACAAVALFVKSERDA